MSKKIEVLVTINEVVFSITANNMEEAKEIQEQVEDGEIDKISIEVEDKEVDSIFRTLKKDGWDLTANEADNIESDENINKVIKNLKREDIEIEEEDKEQTQFWLNGIDGIFILYKDLEDETQWVIYNGWDN